MKTKKQIQENLNRVIEWTAMEAIVLNDKTNFSLKEIISIIKEGWDDFGLWVYEQGPFKKGGKQ